VYAHGNHDVLMSMAQGQSNMAGAFTALGESPVVTYFPQTLAMEAAGLAPASSASLDLSAIANPSVLNTNGSSRISSVERIDLATDTAANTLTLNAKNVADMAGMNLFNSGNVTGGTYVFGAVEARHQLIVDGNAADSVITTGGFADSGQTAIINGHTYEVYNQGLYAQLLVEQGVIVA
jgi:hypothetical protein